MKKTKDKKKSKGGKKFQYKSTSAERLKQQAEQTGSRFDGIYKANVETFKFKVGDNTFRILPPTWDGADYYGYEVWAHSYVGSNNGTYLCPRKMKNKPCAICDVEKETRDSGDKEEASQLAARQRYLFWALDRDDEKAGAKIVEMSWTLDQSVASLLINKRTGKVIALDHPTEGRDVTIQRRGQGLNTKYYGQRIESEATPILDDEEEMDELLEYVRENPIPSLLKFYDNEYLEGIISGTAPDPDDDDDDDDDEDDKKS